MTKENKETQTPQPPKKEDRLAEALRANLQRRKAQARVRKHTDKPDEG